MKCDRQKKLENRMRWRAIRNLLKLESEPKGYCTDRFADPKNQA